MCGQFKNASAPVQRNNNKCAVLFGGLFVLVIFLNSVSCKSISQQQQQQSQPLAAPDLIQIKLGK